MLDNALRIERLTSSGVMFKEVFRESKFKDWEGITSAGAPIASSMLDGEHPRVSLKKSSIGLTSFVGVQSTIAARGRAQAPEGYG